MNHSQAPEIVLRGRGEYIQSRTEILFQFLSKSEERVLNYLFALNTGGLVAGLTYVATQSSNWPIKFSIIASALGAIFILLHATVGYYRAVRIVREYQVDVRDYLNDKMVWGDLCSKDDARSKGTLLGHLLGWSSGVSFVAALVLGIIGVR